MPRFQANRTSRRRLQGMVQFVARFDLVEGPRLVDIVDFDSPSIG